ncbi:MAG: YigZ family protein [Clostridia bacterium]|nr:YigZ family protein [Clostridia bacterium]
MNFYKTISSENNAELIIKKSKFIGICAHVNTKEQVQNFLDKLKSHYSGANHICYGYILEKNDEKCFDDNEPTGTAGLPILNIIKKQQLNNIIIAVIRYFGGIKLGAGGLIRAYGKTASESLKGVKISEYISMKEYQMQLSYDEASSLDKIKQPDFFEITKKQYDEQVIVDLVVLEENKNLLQEFLNNIFNKEVELNFIKTILKEKK